MEYPKLRKDLIVKLNAIQSKGFSYQEICDFVNDKQNSFTLFKDFFSRFQSKPTFYKGQAKKEKLHIIYTLVLNFYNQNLNEDDFLKEELKKIIKEALSLEFESYIEINRSPRSYKSKLLKYYEHKSPAILSIQNNWLHKQQYEWRLDVTNYGSNFKLLELDIVSIFSNNAVIKTNEYWKLFWINAPLNELQYKFEAINAQSYLLSKDKENNWKIADNIYTGISSRIRPEYVKYESLKRELSNKLDDNITYASSLIEQNKLLNTIAFIQLLKGENLTEEDANELIHLKESCIENHRLLNTDVVDLSTFKEERRVIQYKIKECFRKIVKQMKRP